MKFSRGKKILSLILSILIIIPSFNVFATDVKEDIKQDNIEIIDGTTYGQNEENLIIKNEIDSNIEEQDSLIENEIESYREDETITNEELSKEELINTDTIDIEDNILVGEVYEIKEETYPYSKANIAPDFEREEMQLKYESLFYEKKLKVKTDKSYEIALAYSDGSYTYLDSTDSFEEAKEKVKETEKNIGNNDTMPVIINEDGQTVYSTFSMGRIWKHIGGAPDPTFNNNTLVYTDSSLQKVFTYVNQGYVDDVPVIQDNGTSAKIQVSGYTGWVNKNASLNEYDLVIVPINQVTNPSYYFNKGGVLYHFISSNFTSSTEKGTKVTIGLAPEYLKEGVRYLSYDGNYFYDGSNITNGLTNLITDLRAGNKNNSVNKNNMYHSYFNYLPFRSRTTYTAEQLNKYIEANTNSYSKLRNTGQAFINAQNEYGVNALLALGVAINESGWGQSSIAQEKNNIFGINAVDSSPGQSSNYYKSVEICIDEFAEYWISTGYADPQDLRYYGGYLGNKKLGANVKYASDPFWGEKASAHAFNGDLYLSNGNINGLNDYNALTVIKYIGPNAVINSNNNLLYNISDKFNLYSGYVGTVAVVADKNIKVINGKSCLEIYPERNTAVVSGGNANEFHGAYNWNSKAYIESKNIEFISNSKNGTVPIDPMYKNKWKKVNDKWYYYDANCVLSRGWKYINLKWYYFDKDTAEMRTGWVLDKDKWYYLNDDGEMETGLINISGKLYYLNSNGEMEYGWKEIMNNKYYFTEDGSAKIGWLLYNGDWYYFDENGHSKTGWLLEEDKWYYLNDYGIKLTGLVEINKKLYYLDNDGVMQTGWQKVSKDWYYFDENGKAKTGWLLDSEKWYYLNNDGKMATGLIKINKKLYYLDNSGAMQSGWQKASGDWYYFNENGEAKTGWLLDSEKWYYLNNDGKMATGLIEVNKKLYYLDNSGAMQSGWQKVSEDWYYFNVNGEAKTGWLLDLGKWYYLNSDGKMATGWIEVAGSRYYLYENGVMAANTTIDGCRLGSDGAVI